MEKALQLYKELLQVYTEQVKELEQEKSELEKQQHIGVVPYKMLNSRMFTPDAYLTNSFNGGVGYESKNIIMPSLVKFLAEYEKFTDEEKLVFESLKDKNTYQAYLDEIFIKIVPFKRFLTLELNEYIRKENELVHPYRPQRQNAARQWAKYREDEREYDNKLSVIKSCIKEVKARIELFDELSS